jgi:hypothetical protein
MRRRVAARVHGWVLTLAVAVPLPALACPNCYSASGPRVLLMYYLSTAALTVMPFAIIGAIVGLAMFFKRQLQEDAEATVAAETQP